MLERIRIVIRGAVQGVGFRPFVYRLARELDLPGWVSNSPQGVFIEVEGEKDRLESFLLRVEKEKPPRASIQSLEFSFLDAAALRGFEIRTSDTEGEKTALVLPDIATCTDCLREVFDPGDRRHLYPFTNCTNCGPRYSIIESLPYDRRNTSMKSFEMCPACRHEYEDPDDRRFHAQPVACPDCGPRLALWDGSSRELSTRHEALVATGEALRAGRIVALKGLGGFQLLVDARNEEAVARLRARKRREEKPFALMAPTLESVEEDCVISELETRLLQSPESPIVLLRRKPDASRIAPSVAPRNPQLGIMLPYTPLHHVLLRELGRPVVATSGNWSDEPICIDEHEALERLGDVADLFLAHDRPIVRYVDDSIVRVVLGRELVLRRARGYAPLPLAVPSAASGILAVGGHLKSTVALSVGANVFISQHIGDLESSEATRAFRRTIEDFRDLYGAAIERVAADMHPDYLSTRFAQTLDVPRVHVQHHFAHVAACMAENRLQGPVLGVSWDGTGYGTDGTVWGGEFLLSEGSTFDRVAHLRRFPLPGGDRAVREPRRSALGVLYAIWGEELFERKALLSRLSFAATELPVLRQMLVQGLNTPATSSAGRLFDAVSSLIGVRQKTTFEGQAAMELEYTVDEGDAGEPYPTRLTSHRETPIVIDWEPAVSAILDNLEEKTPVGVIAARFHRMLAAAIVEVAEIVGNERVVLTGGFFQNRILTEETVKRLESRGFRAYCHQRIPPNDGGISLGQAVVAALSQGGSS